MGKYIDKEKLEKVRAEIERVKKNQEGVFTSYTDGKFDLCEYLLDFIDSMQEESKECMYLKDNYTDEDRKVLCDGCEEKCKHDKSDNFTKALAECIHNAQCNVVDPMVFAEIWKDELIKLSKCEEPASEDLEEAAFDYAEACKYDGGEKLLCVEHFKAGANWKNEQMMAKAVDATVHIDAGCYPYIPQIELYDYDKDIPLAKEGDKYKLILIKED